MAAPRSPNAPRVLALARRPLDRVHAAQLRRAAAAVAMVFALGTALAACGAGAGTMPPIRPGTSDHPRAVVILAKDYLFLPPTLELVPGETVLLQVINGGLAVHEAVLGPIAVQDAWEAAEAPTASAPPGASPAVSVAPGLEGVRVGVASGQRIDRAWTVPSDGPTAPGGWFLGCHIPGHWAQGMVVPVRWVGSDGTPLAGAPEASVSVAPR